MREIMTNPESPTENADRTAGRGRSDSVRRRRVLKTVGTGGTIAITSLAGCTGGGGGGGGNGSSGGGGSSDTAKIGIIIPMSGDHSGQGTLYRPGFEAWSNVVNSNVDGMDVELRFEDNNSAEQRTSRVASQLVDWGADAMINAYSSPLTRAAGNIAESNQIPLLSTGSSNYELHAGFDWVFEFEYPISQPAAGPLLERTPITKVATWSTDLSWATLSKKKFVEETVPDGVEVVYNDTHPDNARDFSSYVLRAMENGAEALVTVQYAKHIPPQVRNIANSDWNPKFISMVNGNSPLIQDQLPTEMRKGITGPVLWNQTVETPGSQEFIEAVNEITGGDPEPDYHTALAFGSLEVLGAAMRELGSDFHNSEQVQQFLYDQQVETVLGTSEFDDRGVQVGTPWLQVQWKGDDTTPFIWPDDVAEAEFEYPMQW
jgi:ABC-type branched-subunit amino acid transport system substrate-binding protein